jgi:acyl-CoA dehydrogenase
MIGTLPEEYLKTKQQIREFVQTDLEPYAEDVEVNNRIPEHILEKMKQRGLFGLTIPKAYGGGGMSKLEFCLVEQELSKTHFAFLDIISLNNGLGSKSIVLDGSEAMKRKYLPQLASGRLISAFALTEPNAGSDAAGITTSAVRQGDHFVLNGMKHFITNAPIADLFIVIAVTDPELRTRGGITAFVVEKGAPGLSIGHVHNTMGMRGAHKSEVIFKDTPVPVENVIGEVGKGFQVAMKTVDDGRMGVASTSLGMAERLLELSIGHAQRTMRNGKPLADGQAIQWMLADMGTEIYSAQAMIYATAAKIDRQEDAALEVAMCKLYASEMVGRVVDQAMEIFGRDGLRKGSTVERMCRDARILRIFEGTAEIHRVIIGRYLLKGKRTACAAVEKQASGQGGRA